MITSSPETIRAYTAAGWWGTETIADLLRRAAGANPERVAVVDPPNRAELTAGTPGRWTYRELSDGVDRLASALLAAGVGKDDVVMIQLPNVIELPLALLAAARIGAVASPLPIQYRQHELRLTTATVAPKAFVTTARFMGHDHVAMVRELAPELPLFAVADAEAALPNGVRPLADVLAAEADGAALDAHASAHAVDANDTWTVCWTSGTETEPKGVPRSHNMWIAIAYGTTDGAGLRDGDVLLNPFPMVNMSGIGGMFVPWLQVAGTLVMHHPMSLPVFLQQIAVERAVYTVAPPVLLSLLLMQDALMAQADVSSLRVIGSGSAPLSAFMVTGWKDRFGIDVLNFFGSNEGIALVGDTNTVPDAVERARYFPRFGVAGIGGEHGEGWGNRGALGQRGRLVDPLSGAEITEPDIPGELVISGPTVFAGYYGRPDMTARAFTADGFYRTGDLFEIARSESGAPDRYRFVGRARDLIIRGGMKIAPEELEALLAQHPAIAEVAVVGVPDRRLEDEMRICVAVVPKPGQQVTLGDVRGFLKEKQVAGYKMPKEVTTVEALPRNPLGKVLKRDLRMRFEGAGAARSVAEKAP